MDRRAWAVLGGIAGLALLVLAFAWWAQPGDAPPEPVKIASHKPGKPRKPRPLLPSPIEEPQAPEVPVVPDPLPLPVSPEVAAKPGDTAEPAQTATLRIAVGGLGSADAEVHLEGCGFGGWMWVGSATQFDNIAAPCTLSAQARRRDGGLFTRSDQVELGLEPGDQGSISLVLPSERTGGLGVQFEPTEDGFRVVRILPGTPASKLGLEAGDVILEVDGLPAAALTADEFIGTMTGPEGSVVDFVVGQRMDTGLREAHFEVERTFLEG